MNQELKLNLHIKVQLITILINNKCHNNSSQAIRCNRTIVKQIFNLATNNSSSSNHHSINSSNHHKCSINKKQNKILQEFLLKVQQCKCNNLNQNQECHLNTWEVTQAKIKVQAQIQGITGEVVQLQCYLLINNNKLYMGKEVIISIINQISKEINQLHQPTHSKDLLPIIHNLALEGQELNFIDFKVIYFNNS